MTTDPLPFRASLEDYQSQARALFEALQARDNSVEWRFKWEHPRFRGKTVTEVRSAALDLNDAELVVAREYGFHDWPHLVAFTELVRRDAAVERFESAVEAVIAGDVGTLQSMLQENPDLIHARSARRHRATLLHYIAANGVEGHRQKTPPYAVDIAKLLLDAGAEVDALADMYDEQCTTMSMLVSSSPPNDAGLQVALAETLLDHGADLDGRGSKWQSAVLTALTFGFLRTAEALARRGPPLNDIAALAGLGRADDVARLIPTADGSSRHAALALAAQHGQAAVVELLLDAGEDPNRCNPDGFHSHATPLHQAVWADHMPVVQLLVEHSARLDIRDTIYEATPLGWANHGGRTAIADYLRARGAT